MADSIIRIRQARKRFGAVEALRGVDLEVARGEVVLVVGPSGSGKSTLLRAVNRLETLSSGEIWVEDAKDRGSVFVVRVPKDPPTRTHAR